MSEVKKDKLQIKDYIIDFSTIPYNRKLEERALYPFSELNYMTGGMELGEMSIIAGESGGGKTTFISQTVATIIKDDKIMCVYGEGTIEKQQQAVYRQMTPYDKEVYQYLFYYKTDRKTNIGRYFVNEPSEKIIKEKTVKKLFYYDPKYGMTMDKIMEGIDFCFKKGGIKYFLVDNIMQIETLTQNEVKEIKDNMETIRRYLIDNLVHIVLVAHYRKPQEYFAIRRLLVDVAGTSAIGQKSATALNIIRLDSIDKTSKQYLSFKRIIALNNYNLDDADSVIEVLKTRHNKLGFVCLKFNNISNTYYECNKIDPIKTDVMNPILYESKQERLKEITTEDNDYNIF